MLSLRFPISFENSLITPFKPRPSRFQTPTVQSLPRLSSSLSLPRATTAGVVLKEEDRELSNNRFAPRGDFPPGGEPLPAGLQRELMPRHVAVIMDGNVRWERRRGLPAGSGHEAGARSLRELVELCWKWGIRVLTVFAFSYDNWVRPQVEVDFLMNLFEKMTSSEIDSFARAICIVLLGCGGIGKFVPFVVSYSTTEEDMAPYRASKPFLLPRGLQPVGWYSNFGHWGFVKAPQLFTETDK
ncbi:hypothetical protein PRUPE_6G058100 [Prunus persica]|uniref:Alkyl transferase n=1 Tax=Prunus persica TaxID=3760 RepID=A0A251NKS4_PRUPE|nr:hypothetical protein PRUPE_6G058100 [Prunus persica]